MCQTSYKVIGQTTPNPGLSQEVEHNRSYELRLWHALRQIIRADKNIPCQPWGMADKQLARVRQIIGADKSYLATPGVWHISH